MQNQITELKEQIQKDFPWSEPKLTLFPSGAAILDVKIGSETYVLEYHKVVGLGVNRMSVATFGWEGYENSFKDLDSARAFLFGLLTAANQNK